MSVTVARTYSSEWIDVVDPNESEVLSAAERGYTSAANKDCHSSSGTAIEGRVSASTNDPSNRTTPDDTSSPPIGTDSSAEQPIDETSIETPMGSPSEHVGYGSPLDETPSSTPLRAPSDKCAGSIVAACAIENDGGVRNVNVMMASIDGVHMSAPRRSQRSSKQRRKEYADGASARSGESADAPVPTRIATAALSDFSVRKAIGTGTFGDVMLGRHLSSDETVAIKRIDKALAVRLKQVEHVHNERALLAHVKSPFVIRFHSAFQDKEHLYIVTEYVPGGELFTQLRARGHFSERDGKLYAAQLVCVLRHLHARGIVYRDIKPENVLLDALGNIKLCDFGFAKRLWHRSFTVLGTPEYMAPEIIQSRGHDFGVDWWALGVLIYELLVGRAPFTSRDLMRLYSKILKGKLRFPPELSAEACDLIGSLLRSEPSMRLGCSGNGALDVMDAAWFAELDWQRVQAREYDMPWRPKLSSAVDTRHYAVGLESSFQRKFPPTKTDAYFREW